LRTTFLDAVPKGIGFYPLEEIGAYDYEWWNGRLMVWEAPDPGASYVLGVDTAEGVGADRSVIQVLRRGDRRRADMQVAEFASDHHNPLELAPIVNALGRLYGEADGTEALAVIECNNVGGTDCQHMLRTQFDYGNFFTWKVYDKRTNIYTNRIGWWTNRSTRPKLIVHGLNALSKGDVVVSSPFLLDELEDFEGDIYRAQAKAKAGRHDDRVLAFLIAYVGAHDDEWLAGEDVAAERRLLTLAGEVKQREEKKVGTRASWQNTACTVEQMYSDWDAVLD
jgi:hypothetical protein